MGDRIRQWHKFGTSLRVRGVDQRLPDVWLGQSGVACVLVARRGDRLQEIADRYSNFEVLEADLMTDEGCAKVVARIDDEQRPIDLVVNNAGFGSSG